MFTVEIGKEPDVVDITLDDEGIDDLIRRLTRLRGKRDHEHLMTPSWGGYELSETRNTAESVLVHQVNIYSVGPDKK